MKQLLLSFLATAPAMLSAQTFDWANAYIGGGQTVGQTVTTDPSGNVLAAGVFTDVTDFDAGPGTVSLTPAGDNDVYITKTDASGNLLWARSVGSGGYDNAYGITTDAAGNVYVTGIFHFQADFDPGAAEFNVLSNGGADVYILKLTPAGAFSWVKTFGGANDDYAFGIALDGAGNIHTTGYFMGAVDFDPGAGTFSMTGVGDYDGFISKLSAAGNFLWAKSFTGPSSTIPQSIAVDDAGNVYTSGGFRWNADFDPGPAVFTLTAPELDTDTYLCKLDASGNFVWAKHFGGEGTDIGFSLAIDSQQNILMGGFFRGIFDCDPNAGTSNLFVSGFQDGFLVKLTPAGTLIWGKKLGGIGDDSIYSIALDGSDNLYATGYFQGTVDFDPGSGVYSLASAAGSGDIFVCKLNSSGNFRWARAMNGNGFDQGSAITVASQAVYTTGYFNGTVDFDPGAATYFYSSLVNDAFLVKLEACQSTSGTATVTACDSYTWSNGVTYTASNTSATQVLTNDDGCDSTVTLNLTLNYSSFSTTNLSVCDSYTWSNGMNYTTSGTYTQTLTNSVGCDLTETLNLTIYHSEASSLTETACDAFTLNGTTYTSSGTYVQQLQTVHGCDSVVTLNLTLLQSTSSQDVIGNCESYTWTNGTTYTVSGTYTQTLQNSAGCDSTATLLLTIFEDAVSATNAAACMEYTWTNGVTYTSSGTYTQQLQTVHGCDSTATLNLVIGVSMPTAIITQNGGTLTANASSGTYQWIECNSGDPVSGATGQSFTPVVNGSYAVALTENGCTDYSECIVIDDVGLEELNGNGIGIYPNPSSGVFTVAVTAPVAAVVTDASGKVLLKQELTEGENSIVLHAANGIYFLKAGNAVKRLILER